MEGGLTASTRAVATRNYVLTTAKALPRALSRADYGNAAIDPAPLSFHLFPLVPGWNFPIICPFLVREDRMRGLRDRCWRKKLRAIIRMTHRGRPSRISPEESP